MPESLPLYMSAVMIGLDSLLQYNGTCGFKVRMVRVMLPQYTNSVVPAAIPQEEESSEDGSG
jgi:hypothetical protein